MSALRQACAPTASVQTQMAPSAVNACQAFHFLHPDCPALMWTSVWRTRSSASKAAARTHLAPTSACARMVLSIPLMVGSVAIRMSVHRAGCATMVGVLIWTAGSDVYVIQAISWPPMVRPVWTLMSAQATPARVDSAQIQMVVSSVNA